VSIDTNRDAYICNVVSAGNRRTASRRAEMRPAALAACAGELVKARADSCWPAPRRGGVLGSAGEITKLRRQWQHLAGPPPCLPIFSSSICCAIRKGAGNRRSGTPGRDLQEVRRRSTACRCAATH